MNYAWIENGIVANIIWLHPGNAADFPSAAPIGDIPAAIGDVYTDGVFYRDGERVLSIAEQLASAQAALAEIEEA
jgi:hypothetical protein